LSDPVAQWIESPVGAVATALLNGADIRHTVSRRSSGLMTASWSRFVPRWLRHSTVEMRLLRPDSDDHPVISDPAGVSEMTRAGLEGLLLRTADDLSPWDPETDARREACLHSAEERRPLAEALLDCWLPELQRGLSWPQWTIAFGGETGFDRDLFDTPEGMQLEYGDGHFPWGGAWSFTPTEASGELLECV